MPLPEPITLFLSKNSLRNATLDCDFSGVHYRVETPTKGLKTTRIAKLYRWDRETNEEFLVGEWERNAIKHDRMRSLRPGSKNELDEWKPIDEHLEKTWGFPSLENYTFTGDDGKRYTWKCVWSLKLYCNDAANPKEPVAEFKRPNYCFKKRKACIVVKPEAQDIMDKLILTFLYCEKKRRDSEKAAAASGGGGGGGGGG